MERAGIHPSREELFAYWKNGLETTDRERVAGHVTACEFCSEIMADLIELSDAEAKLNQSPLSPETETKMFDLYRQLFAGQIVPLTGREEIQPSHYHMAADGTQPARPVVENLATVFSDEPEIVLKIMRDNKGNRTYLHLIADNPALTSHVLVESPESHRAYVTDSAGHADMEDAADFDAAAAKWRVKLPDAEFPLLPLKVDEEIPGAFTETILETERGDRVRLTLEERVGGKQIKVEVLSLEGHPPADPLTAAISFGSKIDTRQGVGSKPVIFRVEQLPTAIQLRLYK